MITYTLMTPDGSYTYDADNHIEAFAHLSDTMCASYTPGTTGVLLCCGSLICTFRVPEPEHR